MNDFVINFLGCGFTLSILFFVIQMVLNETLCRKQAQLMREYRGLSDKWMMLYFNTKEGQVARKRLKDEFMIIVHPDGTIEREKEEKL